MGSNRCRGWGGGGGGRSGFESLQRFAPPESRRDPEQQRERMIRCHCGRLRELGVEVDPQRVEPPAARRRQCSRKRYNGQLGIRSR